ncbi:amidophosphoribosyltransferase, partial [Tilletia horrida]
MSIADLGFCESVMPHSRWQTNIGLTKVEQELCTRLAFLTLHIQQGEATIITRNAFSPRSFRDVHQEAAAQLSFAPDIFEYVCFARPDSVLDRISVYRSRMAMGDKLAEEVRRVLKEAGETVDVVIPVPDTSRVSALQVAQRLNIPYREGFVKNRYVGRTFIMPGQSVRRKNVRRKLNAMALEFSGKSVLLVDDSIVRGTTSKEIIQMARDAGARKVIMASCAPPIRYSNVYGIDMPSRHELVAHGRSELEVAAYIQADLVIYQTLPDLIESVRQFNPAIN